MRKFEVHFDKTIYVGMYTLDIQDLYEFHHEYVLPLNRKIYEVCNVH